MQWFTLERKRDMKKKQNPNRNMWRTLIISTLLTVLFYNFFINDDLTSIVDKTKPEYVSLPVLTRIIEDNVEEESVKVLETSEGNVLVTVGDEDSKNVKQYETQVNPRESGITDIIKSNDVDYDFVVPFNMLGAISNILFIGIFLAILFFMIMPMLKARGNTSKSTKKTKNIPDISFDDIGGISDEAKSEIFQVQNLLKKAEEAKSLGLRPSKGVLLHGPSGTGKTLVAKAIANSYNANFIVAEGSSFVEMFAGMGAKRVRDLFDKARKNAPSVIFIDEIDAVAKSRSANGQMSNDEREQTLNQILVEMDGIESSQDVFVVAATNRLDVLDSALLRPGRFDYKINIDLPDVDGRKEIIKIHMKGKSFSDEVTERIDEVAGATRGFSGADLEMLFLHAGYHALSEDRKEITMEDVNYGQDRLIVGSGGRKINSLETKTRVAYHEAGHAAVTALVSPNSIRKATIVPRGQALGFVAHVPKEGLYTKPELLDQLKIMVAGGVAEQMMFDNHSSGVSDDFKKTKELIEKMIEDWGMGETKLLPSFTDEEKASRSKRMYQSTIDSTFKLLRENQDFFESVAELLMEKETVDGSEIEQLKNISK